MTITARALKGLQDLRRELLGDQAHAELDDTTTTGPMTLERSPRP